MESCYASRKRLLLVKWIVGLGKPTKPSVRSPSSKYLMFVQFRVWTQVCIFLRTLVLPSHGTEWYSPLYREDLELRKSYRPGLDNSSGGFEMMKRWTARESARWLGGLLI